MNPGDYDEAVSSEEGELDRETLQESLEEALELDSQSQIFLELRKQNLELLKIATQVAGYAGTHAPLKPADLKSALRNIWDVYSEVYSWVDPEETQEEDEEEEYDEDED